MEGQGVLFKLAPFNSRLYLKDDKVCLLEFALFFSDVSRQFLFRKRFFGLLCVAEVSSVLDVSCKRNRKLFSKKGLKAELRASEAFTSDVLSCRSGFELHGIQVRDINLVALGSQHFLGSRFSCSVERGRALVSVHDQYRLCC